MLDGGRIVTLCEDIEGSETVSAVDTKRKELSVHVDSALHCRVDEHNHQLVVLRTEPTPTHAKLSLELYPLDGAPVVTVPFPEAKSFGGAMLWIADGVASPRGRRLPRRPSS